MSSTAENVTAVPGDKYILPRNDDEYQRLDLQHTYLTASVTDGRLIYDKEFQVKPGNRILDAGTGAGSWILALSKEVPDSAELVGSDISSSMFPKLFPSNASFTEASTTSLPESWTGTFDFVNQRLLVAAFTVSDWTTALSEIFRVLKPGGMVQLVEITSSYPSGEGLEATGRMMDLLISIWQKGGYIHTASDDLPKMMAAAGFVDIRTDIRRGPVGSSWGEIGIVGAQNLGKARRAIGTLLMAKGGLGQVGSLEDFYALVDAEQKEWNTISGLYFNYAVISARKP